MFKASLTYLTVVMLGYIVDFSIYTLMLALGAWVVWANTIAFFVGAVVNAILIRRFVFPDNRFRAGKDLGLTLLVNIFFFVLGTWLLSWLVTTEGINPYVAKVLTNGLTFAGNFLTRAAFFRKTQCSLIFQK